MLLLYIAVVLCVVIDQLYADKCDYHTICRLLSYLLADNWVICMLSLRCRLLQYAVFVGINGWHATTFLKYIFCFIFQINLFFRYHVYFLRLQCIIKQLSDSVFLICKIINVSVRVICLAFGSLITLTSTLIIPHITKTSSNNCLL